MSFRNYIILGKWGGADIRAVETNAAEQFLAQFWPSHAERKASARVWRDCMRPAAFLCPFEKISPPQKPHRAPQKPHRLSAKLNERVTDIAQP